MTSVEKQRYRDGWQRIQERFLLDGDASRVLAERTELVDSIVRDAYSEYLQPAFPGGMSLLAVGGYGRRQMFPYSDVDLLLLVEREPQSKEQRDALSAFLRSLWDQGLRLSHSVRRVAECCDINDQNVELNISLLDQRFLAGETLLYQRLAVELPRFVHRRRQELTRHLCKMTRSRHAKYHATIFHLEPNVKEMPGGMRDYQVLSWMNQLRDAQPDRLVKTVLFPELAEAYQFLCGVRCHLHIGAGRDSNTLTFDIQEALAEHPVSSPSKAAEWMRLYYRYAGEIARQTLRWVEESEERGSSLLGQFRSWRSRLSNADIAVLHERAYIKASAQLAGDPDLVLRVFQFVARHGIRLSWEAEKRIAEHMPSIMGQFAKPRSTWWAIREILSLPHADLALRSMHETGVLRVVFPEWGKIEWLVLRDFVHRYTVDEHTLMTIQTLCELARTENAPPGRFATLLSEIPDLPLLRFALLFHDTGKALADAAHAAESMRLAQEAMDRIRMPEPDRQRVLFLIEHHLDLSAAIHSRDLDEPSTARDLAARIGTIEALKELTLLTYADISAVHPTAMTPWRMEQLWRVYLVTFLELTRELDTSRIQNIEQLSPEKAEFLKGFPTRYLRIHTPAEIDSHLQLELRSRERGVTVEIRRENGYFGLVVVTRDRPFLFAAIAGAISSFGLNILKAEAFSNGRGTVLDTFVFSDPNKTLELNPPEVERLRLIVERVVLGKESVKLLLAGRPKVTLPSRGAKVRPVVTFDSAASESATLVEIVAQDRPGLLYDLAGTLSSAGCNIEVVLIDTEAHKALDVFYVTLRGRKLSERQQEELRTQLLAVCKS